MERLPTGGLNDESLPKHSEVEDFTHLHNLRRQIASFEDVTDRVSAQRAWSNFRSQLFQRYFRLIHHMIRNDGLPITDDRVQEGSVALLRAIDKANLEMLAEGNTFSTFACTCIANQLKRDFAYNSALKRRAKVISADTPYFVPLSHQTGRRLPGLSDDPDPGVHMWHQTTPADSLPSGDPPPEKEVIDRDMREYVANLLRDLPQRDTEVLRKRYGLEGDGPKSLKDISDDLGVSRERVRQIVATALSRLRHILESQSSSPASVLASLLDPCAGGKDPPSPWANNGRLPSALPTASYAPTIRAACAIIGITETRFAQYIGVGQSDLSGILSGRIVRNSSVPKKIADKLGVSLETFLSLDAQTLARHITENIILPPPQEQDLTLKIHRAMSE